MQRCSFLASGWHDTFDVLSAYPKPGDRCRAGGSFHESQDAFPLYVYDGINPFHHRDGVNLGRSTSR